MENVGKFVKVRRDFRERFLVNFELLKTTVNAKKKKKRKKVIKWEKFLMEQVPQAI